MACVVSSGIELPVGSRLGRAAPAGWTDSCLHLVRNFHSALDSCIRASYLYARRIWIEALTFSIHRSFAFSDPWATFARGAGLWIGELAPSMLEETTQLWIKHSSCARLPAGKHKTTSSCFWSGSSGFPFLLILFTATRGAQNIVRERGSSCPGRTN
jgi:hypothetical protein